MKTKMKTNRGAAKRFKRMGKGRLKCAKAFKNHILTKKSKKRKHRLRLKTEIDAADLNMAKRLLCDK